MLVDEEIVVGPVEGVVQHGPVQPKLHVAYVEQGHEERECVADLHFHRIAYAFDRALCQIWVVRVPNYDPDPHATPRLVRKQTEEADIFRQE